MSAVRRIAMWSGPRNISTAMMRAFENRDDTAVWDEPLYAYYLSATGVDHPGAEEVIAARETDWRKVAEGIIGPVPGDKPVFFQKHMTHHLLDEIDRGWMDQVVNCFLIRDPEEVVASYARRRETVTVEDVGMVQQAAIFDYVQRRAGELPPVIDARDVLENPEGLLRRLCAALDLEFSDRMLSWPPGPRPSDGVWAKHWYDSVHASTGFRPYQSRRRALEPALGDIVAACEPHYRRLYEGRLHA